MAELIDHLMQDHKVLLTAIASNLSAMSAKGYSEAKLTALINAGEELSQKETAQQRAFQFVSEKTAEQNNAINNISHLIQQVKDSAKSHFGKDPAKLKLFKVGETVPRTVKGLSTASKYMAQLVNEYHDDLLANGLSQAEIDEMMTAYGTLSGLDAVQENGKKIQNTATMVRDESAKKLKELIFRTRNFANSCFAKNPEILLQFKPIPRGAKRKNGNGSDGTDESNPGAA